MSTSSSALRLAAPVIAVGDVEYFKPEGIPEPVLTYNVQEVISNRLMAGEKTEGAV